jgi:hypothetical protein
MNSKTSNYKTSNYKASNYRARNSTAKPELRYKNPEPNEDITYLLVPFREKEYAKTKNARYAPKYGLWFTKKTNPNYEILTKKYPFVPYDIKYLYVPYAEKDTAKMRGAKWCPIAARWYSLHGTAGFEEWLTPKEEDEEELPIVPRLSKPYNINGRSVRILLNNRAPPETTPPAPVRTPSAPVRTSAED